MGEWIKSSKCAFTPDGDPLWECGECGCGEHVYGIENCNEPKRYCPDCGSYNLYPWEEKKCKNCKYFHKLKQKFQVHKGYSESSCCIALTRQNESPDDYDSFVVETNEDDMCEMFKIK